MAFQFTYTFCSAPEEEQSMAHKEQAKASSMFQSYKRQMRQQNDDRDTDEGSHMIKIGVTDHEGNPLEQYSHNCHCHSF